MKLGAHIIMPDHVHGIVIFNKPDFAPRERTKNKFGPQYMNLPSIIRGFKVGVTKNARTIHTSFAWQSRYHDHIIRDEWSYKRISAYIKNNPKKWKG